MSASKLLIGCWLGLAALSTLTVLLGGSGSGLLLGAAILAAALGKAWLITEGFMELRHAPRLWRLLLLGWPLLLAGGVLALLPQLA
ncbi:cytochrome C oxidase subunit IV family protein [Pseudomonas oligotrophica]|uniref:cytochrome C oxidase subunit IV family protein n=1 Tax=Pseudomonas oligotrophica TaxID=2912055 RepID=UPI001EFFFD01|nr:cytochrome C oxidase subunit IV family protein [Pseudomonas oligotrophica]MCF7203631.1 cytochrome C oxidase subunit IV family protein [Pseudomonas oligotrophica]